MGAILASPYQRRLPTFSLHGASGERLTIHVSAFMEICFNLDPHQWHKIYLHSSLLFLL